MKIAILGYGKMGKAIDRIAFERGHTVAVIIDVDEEYKLAEDYLKEVDVAIDFTTPRSAIPNIQAMVKNNIPIVVGTTGWYDKLREVEEFCKQRKGAVMYGSNFSVGVNMFFKLNKYMAELMTQYGLDKYDVEVTEIHHTEKLDSPSGTAITLAEDIIENVPFKSEWLNETEEKLVNSREDELKIKSLRKADVKGTHEIKYFSEIDNITIQHEAHNRDGFALGAVLAAEWLVGKTGFFFVKEMFQ